MAQDEIAYARPMDLTDSQVNDLTSGKSLELGESSRPRAVSDKDVKALSAGKKLRLEDFPTIEPVTRAAASTVSGSVEERPRAVSDQDVEALSAGKDIGLQKRDQLQAQKL